MIYKLIIPLLALTSYQSISAQITYTPKHFIAKEDSVKFPSVIPKKSGPVRTYVLDSLEIWDVDDNNTTYIRGVQKALVCSEGMYKNGVRDGLFTVYLIDSTNRTKKYKIAEQLYSRDKLNGVSRVYTLSGNLVSTHAYLSDSLNGSSKNYWIDGKSIMEERVYTNGRHKYVLKEFTTNGDVEAETTFVNDTANGPAKRYYSDGILKEEMTMVNGIPEGIKKYHYPSGKLWMEQELKNGAPWNAVAAYSEDGEKKDAGTLKEGNGTVVIYATNGTKKILSFKNGMEN